MGLASFSSSQNANPCRYKWKSRSFPAGRQAFGDETFEDEFGAEKVVLNPSSYRSHEEYFDDKSMQHRGW